MYWEEYKENALPRPWLCAERTTGGRSIVNHYALSGGCWKKAPNNVDAWS